MVFEKIEWLGGYTSLQDNLTNARYEDPLFTTKTEIR